MTKPQIWVAAVLVLFLLLFFLEKETKRVDVQPKGAPPEIVQQTGQSNKPQTPEQMVASFGCTGCHGADLAGTKMAPDLHNVKNDWTRDQLINYLRNPSSYMNSAKLKTLKEKYPNVMMPSFNNIDVKQLGKIADYLLSLKQ
jgi:mono/diheme cytochrome c family protein